MVLRTTPWSKSSSDTFDVNDGGCFGCCCSSCAFFLLFHNFLSDRSANTSECWSPIPDTIQWQFHSRLLFLHAELVHVFNNSSCIVAVSKHAFFCKHVNREKFSASLRKQKIKKKIYWGSNLNLELKPSTLFSDSLSTTVILTAPSNRLYKLSCKYEQLHGITL